MFALPWAAVTAPEHHCELAERELLLELVVGALSSAVRCIIHMDKSVGRTTCVAD